MSSKDNSLKEPGWPAQHAKRFFMMPNKSGKTQNLASPGLSPLTELDSDPSSAAIEPVKRGRGRPKKNSELTVKKSPKVLRKGHNRISRTYTYPAFLTPENAQIATQYMSEVRAIYEQAALEPTLEAARHLVREKGEKLWWPNRNYLESLLFKLAIQKERFKANMPITPLNTTPTKGTLAGSIVGIVRNQSENTSPLDALFKAHVIQSDPYPVGHWHGHPVYRIKLPVTSGPKGERDYVELDFPLTRMPPQGSSLAQILLIGTNLAVPPPTGHEIWPVMIGNKEYHQPAPRFRIGLVISRTIERDTKLPNYTGVLNLYLSQQEDGQIAIGCLDVLETNEKINFSIPSSYLKRAQILAESPFSHRRRLRFMRWRKSMFHKMAVDIFKKCDTLVIERHQSAPKVIEVFDNMEIGLAPRAQQLNVYLDDIIKELQSSAEFYVASITRRRSSTIPSYADGFNAIA